ncbi:hypothetical protein BN8_05019 [Fibrisoma limi BUZ 3]|uniref:Uncharacterized protein n=1 Tax=Fibrisoma limi BUZ 3 TaxID=1185876 RepID=I2GPA8_9BACT|nr:hypothetical protein BN8_05019 [Fibrisoma limi BUZ 3]
MTIGNHTEHFTLTIRQTAQLISGAFCHYFYTVIFK